MEDRSQLVQKYLYTYPMIEDLRIKSSKMLPKTTRAFLNGGTGHENCLQRNKQALKNIIFQPRFLNRIEHIDLSTEIFGKTYAFPFGISPLGMVDLIWPNIDRNLNQMAYRQNLLRVLSIFASTTYEQAGQSMDQGWFQLYPVRDQKLRQTLMNRARQESFETLVFTIDSAVLGRRESLRRSGAYSPMPPLPTPRKICESLVNYPHWSWGQLRNKLDFVSILERYAASKGVRGKMGFIRQEFAYSSTWTELKEIRDQWPGHLVIKGVMHEEDARQAEELGVDGIWLSNHGGRQLDDVPSPIEVLPKVKSTVSDSMKIMIDSGFRTGMDVIRGLALGADFVFMGRPFVYGFPALGDIGGDVVVEILKEEMTNIMTLHGCSNVADLSRLVPYEN